MFQYQEKIPLDYSSIETLPMQNRRWFCLARIYGPVRKPFWWLQAVQVWRIRREPVSTLIDARRSSLLPIQRCLHLTTARRTRVTTEWWMDVNSERKLDRLTLVFEARLPEHFPWPSALRLALPPIRHSSVKNEAICERSASAFNGNSSELTPVGGLLLSLLV